MSGWVRARRWWAVLGREGKLGCCSLRWRCCTHALHNHTSATSVPPRPLAANDPAACCWSRWWGPPRSSRASLPLRSCPRGAPSCTSAVSAAAEQAQRPGAGGWAACEHTCLHRSVVRSGAGAFCCPLRHPLSAWAHPCAHCTSPSLLPCHSPIRTHPLHSPAPTLRSHPENPPPEPYCSTSLTLKTRAIQPSQPLTNQPPPPPSHPPSPGILSSVMSTFLLMRLATWFLGGAALLFEVELYVGLLAFLGYILFDTQVRLGVLAGIYDSTQGPWETGRCVCGPAGLPGVHPV